MTILHSYVQPLKLDKCRVLITFLQYNMHVQCSTTVWCNDWWREGVGMGCYLLDVRCPGDASMRERHSVTASTCTVMGIQVRDLCTSSSRLTQAEITNSNTPCKPSTIRWSVGGDVGGGGCEIWADSTSHIPEHKIISLLPSDLHYAFCNSD